MEEAPPAAAAGRDWSALVTDLVATVLCELELPDFIRCAAVCKSWCAAARDLRRVGIYSFPQTPCLFYIPAAGAGAGGGSSRSAELYCLADRKPYTVTLPDPPIRERTIAGSSRGWLVTADARSELHLLNPATREQIELPPVATLEQVRPILDDAGDLRSYELSFYDGELEPYRTPGVYPPDELRDVLNIKAALSRDPSPSSSTNKYDDDGGGCVVLIIYHPDRQLAFTTVGDARWHWITTSSYYRSPYSDIAYRDGAFYAMNLLGGIHRYDIQGSRATRTIAFDFTFGYIANHSYMAWMPSGDVLQIWRSTDSPKDEDASPEEQRTVGVEIYKVEFGGQDVVPVDTLGDQAVFIGNNCTLCLSTKDYPDLLPNHVYFTDDDEYMEYCKGDRRDIGVLTLDTSSSHEILSPQPWINWPAPIWIVPSFTKMKK